MTWGKERLGAVTGRCAGARFVRLGRRGVGATDAPGALGADLERFSLNQPCTLLMWALRSRGAAVNKHSLSMVRSAP